MVQLEHPNQLHYLCYLQTRAGHRQPPRGLHGLPFNSRGRAEEVSQQDQSIIKTIMHISFDINGLGIQIQLFAKALRFFFGEESVLTECLNQLQRDCTRQVLCGELHVCH